MLGRAFRDTPSFKAGGQFEPSVILNEYEADPSELRSLLLGSHLKIEKLFARNKDRFGISWMSNYSVRILPGLEPRFMPNKPGTSTPILPPRRDGALPFAGLAGTSGFEYKTWLVNPVVLMPWLRKDLEAAGVSVKVGEEHAVTGLPQLLALDENIVVNCTGMGSASLFPERDRLGRPRLLGKKGQLAILKPQKNTRFLFSGGCGMMERRISYVFSRSDGIVVGGSVEEAFTDGGTADPDKVREILATAKRLFAGHVPDCGHVGPVA